MEEKDLMKAIELKKKLDSKRELLQFANRPSVDLRVNLEERCDHGRILNMDYLLDDYFIEGLKAKVITSIEKDISDLLDELEKL